MSSKNPQSPDIFISYQWDKKPQIEALYRRLTDLGYRCWLDTKQMGGGQDLNEEMSNGIRGCKVFLACVTTKYTKSTNCIREVSAADSCQRRIVPLLLEKITWPPKGPMTMVFASKMYIDFCTPNVDVQNDWICPKFDELLKRINQGLKEMKDRVESVQINIMTPSSVEFRPEITPRNLPNRDPSPAPPACHLPPSGSQPTPFVCQPHGGNPPQLAPSKTFEPPVNSPPPKYDDPVSNVGTGGVVYFVTSANPAPVATPEWQPSDSKQNLTSDKEKNTYRKTVKCVVITVIVALAVFLAILLGILFGAGIVSTSSSTTTTLTTISSTSSSTTTTATPTCTHIPKSNCSSSLQFSSSIYYYRVCCPLWDHSCQYTDWPTGLPCSTNSKWYTTLDAGTVCSNCYSYAC